MKYANDYAPAEERLSLTCLHHEADVVKAVFRVDEAGDDMLAAVVLHPAKTRRPVKRAGNGLIRDEGRGENVIDMLAVLLCIKDGNAVYRTRVTGLPAALGKEGRFVKLDEKASVILAAGEDAGFKVADVAVSVK